jgi:hypothetical protein
MIRWSELLRVPPGWYPSDSSCITSHMTSGSAVWRRHNHPVHCGECRPACNRQPSATASAELPPSSEFRQNGASTVVTIESTSSSLLDLCWSRVRRLHGNARIATGPLQWLLRAQQSDGNCLVSCAVGNSAFWFVRERLHTATLVCAAQFFIWRALKWDCVTK